MSKIILHSAFYRRTSRFFAFCLFTIFSSSSFGQSPSDSVTITFRSHESSSTIIFVPGQFNNWGPNSNGAISPGASSQMIYDGSLSSWIKTYSFKIHDPLDTRRTLGDSVFQYKFNRGGSSGGWFSDPLNSEQNSLDNNNSVLRLTNLFWFEYYPTLINQQITRMTVGLIHANSDSVASIKFTTGVSRTSSLTTTDITQFFKREQRVLDVTLSTPIGQGDYVKLVAYTNHGDSVVFQKGGFVPSVMAMPVNTKHGVNLPGTISSDSTTFRLRLKGKSYVLLRVAPLGQSPALAEPLLMYKSTNSEDWWLNVKLAPGTYEYVYELENGKQLFDPWGRWNGEKGSRFTIGPAGLTADDYVWQTANYQRPPLNKVIAYELHVGEFAGGYFGKSAGQGTFRDLIALIPYLDTLGINAIELMPVNDYSQVGKSGHSWGYDLNSYFAIEPAYGEPKDFKALVDAAHARGIAIILDVVFNHLNDTSPLWQMEPDETKNVYFKPQGDLRYNEDRLYFFKDLDHWSSATQELVFEALKMWVFEYKVDGFRYDFTQGIGWNPNDTTVGILGWANKMRALFNGSVYQIAEHLPESPALIYYSGLTGGWHDSFRDEIFNEVVRKNTSLANFENLVIDLGAYSGNDVPAYPYRYADRSEPVNFTVNHDEQSLIFEMTTFQGVGTDEAVKRDKLYATFMFTSLGIPMLWQGMEFSEPRGWSSDGLKLNYRPVQWSWRSTDRGKAHYAYYRPLILQRRFNPALYNGELRKIKRYDAEKVLVWGFEDAPSGSKVMVLANLSGLDRTITNVPWLGKGPWYNVFNQNTYEVSDTTVASFSLPAYTAVVYSNRSNASLGIPVSVETEEETRPTAFRLQQNYPNPFNPRTSFEFQVASSEFISIRLFDVLGREVAVLVNEERAPGVYKVTWDASALPSGVYFYRMQAGAFSSTRKMTLLR